MEFNQICKIDSPAASAAVPALQSQKSSVASSDHKSTSSNGDSGYHSDHGGYHHGIESSKTNAGKAVCVSDENECHSSALSDEDSKNEFHSETVSTSNFISKFAGQDSEFECERAVCMSGTDVSANHKCSTQAKHCDVELVLHQNEMNSYPSCSSLHTNTTAAINSSQNDVEDNFICVTVPSHFPSKPIESSQTSDNAITTAVQELALNIEFCLMFGYKPSQIKTAITKLNYKASKNDILVELSSMVPSMEDSFGEYISKGADRSCDFQSRGPLSIENENKDNHTVEDSENLRPIVIDGSNVAMSHGNKQYFSCQGILLAVDYFRSRNHRDITVFVPTYRKETPRSDAPIRDRQILDKLEEERILVYTPSRYISGKRVTCYDDRFILRLAEETDGVIVSNDNFRDLQSEKPEWKELVEKRLLMYSFASDRFMVPDDPLGRNGPNIDNFLRIRPVSEEQNKPQCPYGKKCTYGKKCKYFHPECARPVSERMKEKSEKRTKASSQCIELAMELIKASDWGNESPPLHTENNHGQEFKSLSSSWKMDSNGRQRRITNGILDDEPNYLPSNKIQSSYENHFGTSHNNSPYTNSCSNLPDAFRQLSVTNQFPMNHNASMACGHSSNQMCYDTHSLKYQQMNERSVHMNFPNVPYVREGGPPDFHMENHTQLKSPVLNQQYQRSSPANLQMYDRNNCANPVLQRQHMNLPSPYQSVPSFQSAYGIPPHPVYTQGYRDSPFQTNQAMVCSYNIAGRQGSTGVHPSMLPPNSYYPNSSRSNSSLSHSYPFISPEKAVISSSYSQQNVGNSSTGSESKTFPPRAPRVYSSPAPQHQHLIQQSPYANNPSYATESQANYSSRLAAPEPPLNNINNPRHYLYKNLCSLFQRHIVEAVMTANPEVREPKLLVKMCLDND